MKEIFPTDYFKEVPLDKYLPVERNMRSQSEGFVKIFNKLMNHYNSLDGIFGNFDYLNVNENFEHIIVIQRKGIEASSIAQLFYEYFHNYAISLLPYDLRVLIYENQMIEHPHNFRTIERLAHSYLKSNYPNKKDIFTHYLKYSYSMMMSKYSEFENNIDQYNGVNKKIKLFIKKNPTTSFIQYYYHKWLNTKEEPNSQIKKYNFTKSIDEEYFHYAYQNLEDLIHSIEEKKLSPFYCKAYDLRSIMLLKELLEEYYGEFRNSFDDSQRKYYKTALRVPLDFASAYNKQVTYTVLEIISRLHEEFLTALISSDFILYVTERWDDIKILNTLEQIANFDFKNSWSVLTARGLLLIFQENYNKALESLIISREKVDNRTKGITELLLSYLKFLHIHNDFISNNSAIVNEIQLHVSLAEYLICAAKYYNLDEILLEEYLNYIKYLNLKMEDILPELRRRDQFLFRQIKKILNYREKILNEKDHNSLLHAFIYDRQIYDTAFYNEKENNIVLKFVVFCAVFMLTPKFPLNLKELNISFNLSDVEMIKEIISNIEKVDSYYLSIFNEVYKTIRINW